MRYQLPAFITFFFFCCTLSTNGQPVYVAQGATGSGNSWADATGDLKNVLDNAQSGDEIWVQGGVYYPTTCSPCDVTAKNMWFAIPNGVKVYGGFAGTETMPDQRDIAANPSYLSGDIDQDGTLENNSFTIVYTFNVNDETTLDGFTLTGGNAVDNNYPVGSPQNSGGGWFNNGATNGFSSSPTIRNCRFENNFAWGYGGALMNDGNFTGSCSSQVINCTFIANRSRIGGGAIYNGGSFSGYSSPDFVDCHFENNECIESDGGAVFNIGSEGGVSNPSFTGCHFLNNFAGHDGGAVYSFAKNGNASPSLTNCLLDGNKGDQGGAMYNDGSFMGFSGPVISNSRFTNNESTVGDGGAIYNSGLLGTCNPEIINTQFDHNLSLFAGGAIFNNGVEGVCNPIITNCRFISNEATTFGGSMYNQGSNGNASPTITNSIFTDNRAVSAGAIYNLGVNQGNANAIMTNCTFYKNNANVGGAVYANAGEDASGTSSPTIVNCIFWENTANDIGDIFRIINGTPTISYSLVDKIDCDDLYHGNGGFLTCEDGMVFNEDPQFVDAPGGDFHLKDSSPVIDLGNNVAVNSSGVNIDLDNLPRIFNGAVDFGVFEYGSMLDGPPVVVQQPVSTDACAGSPISFHVLATGSMPLSYQWLKDGNILNGFTSDTLSIGATQVSDTGIYTCEVTNAAGATTLSLPATLNIFPLLEASLTILGAQDTICQGEEVMLTAQYENGGNSPAFQWYVNGTPLGDNNPVLVINNLSHGDEVSCEMVSSGNCLINTTVFSNTWTVYVENTLAAALTIASSKEHPCEGQSVLFEASSQNGGSTPSYEWSVNGIPTGTDSPTFEYIPQSGDEVQCLLVSSKICVDTAVVESNILIQSTITNEVAMVSITPSIDSIICLGTEVSFTALTEHEGDSPVYKWQINGIEVGENQAIFTTTSLEDEDLISCQLTSSELCLVQNPVFSNEIIVDIDSCTVNIGADLESFYEVVLYPNPAHGRIFVEMSGLSGNFTTRLLNTQGQTLVSNYEEHLSGSLVKQEINLTDFPQGIYYFQIITDGSIATKKFVVY